MRRSPEELRIFQYLFWDWHDSCNLSCGFVLPRRAEAAIEMPTGGGLFGEASGRDESTLIHRRLQGLCRGTGTLSIMHPSSFVVFAFIARAIHLFSDRRPLPSAWKLWCLGVVLLCGTGNAYGLGLKAVVYGTFGATSFVLDDEGQLWAWGSNSGGQYGDGTTQTRLNGTRLPLPEGVNFWSQFVAGSAFATLDDRGRIFGWGQYEGVPNAPGAPLQLTPYLVDPGSWQSIAVAVDRPVSGFQPWGLGATASGELCWIRVPKPTKPGVPPFSERYTEPAPGIGDATGFVEVAAGSGFFLARTESGRVFAAGIGVMGVLGPAGDLKSESFNATFVPVPPPAPGETWSRIAATDSQAFGWSGTGDLYVWGRRFDIDDGWLTDPTPRLVPRPSTGGGWREVSGTGRTEPATLLLSTKGELWAAGTLGLGWITKYGEGRDILRQRSRLAYTESVNPIQSISEGPTHLLVQARDGRIRAWGYNDSLQLGGFPKGDVLEYNSVIPGGEASFLLGRPADVAKLSVDQTGIDILEPTSSKGDGVQPQSVLIHRTGRVDQVLPVNWVVRVRDAQGNRVGPDEQISVLKELVQVALSGSFLPGNPEYASALTPRFAPESNTEYWIDVELSADPSFEIVGPSVLTFHYRPSVPTTYPPSVRQVWPPVDDFFYAEQTMDFAFEVWDRDGYVVSTTLDTFGAGGVFERTRLLASTETNRVHLIEYHLPMINPFDWIGARPILRVRDNQGEFAVLQLPSLRPRSGGIPRLKISVEGRATELWVRQGWGDIVFEGSVDLEHWSPLRTYDKNGGLPAAPIQLTEAERVNRFYRIRSLNR